MQAEAADLAEGSDGAAGEARADGLRRIFDDGQAAPRGDLADPIHGGRPSCEMRPRGDRGLDQGRIDVEILTHVDEDRTRARERHPRSRRHEGIRGGDDLVTLADPESAEAEHEGARAACDADGRRASRERREALLEVCDLLAQDELPAVEHRLDRGHELGLQKTLLNVQGDEGDAQPHRVRGRRTVKSANFIVVGVSRLNPCRCDEIHGSLPQSPHPGKFLRARVPSTLPSQGHAAPESAEIGRSRRDASPRDTLARAPRAATRRPPGVARRR